MSEVEALLQSATAQNTQETYSRGLKCFEEFHYNFGGKKSSWPPTLEHIIEFIGYMSVKGFTDSTAKTYIAGISYYLKLQNHFDFTQNFIVKKLLEGYKRKAKTKDNRMPITGEILTNLVEKLPVVCSNLYETSLFAAAYTTAFFGFFRVGEITSVKKGKQGHEIQFDCIKVSQNKQTVEIRLDHSKTDQMAKGTTVTIRNTNVGINIRPVDILLSYLAKRPKFTGNLFCHYNGEPLTRSQFTGILKKALRLIGVDVTKYKSHSFRIGAATLAAAIGMSEEEICKAGR